MLEKQLAEFAARTRCEADTDFTAQVFGRIAIDRYATAPSAIGDVYVAWTALGASGLRLAGSDGEFEAWYAKRFGRRAVRALERDDIMNAAAARLRGEDVRVPLDLSALSPFEAAVLRKAAEIPRGDARPYWWVARELETPAAMRAVGNALGRNPVPLLVPCHRVIRADMRTGEYVFGAAAKQHLLEDEGVDLAAVDRVTRRGFRYVGCADGFFCLPTCGTVACKVDNPGYLGLHSAHDAVAHGLQPCPTCRPIAA